MRSPRPARTPRPSMSDPMRAWRTAVLFARELKSHLPVAFRIVAPPLAHLHEQEQVDRPFQNFSKLAARGFPDRLDRLPGLAEHDLPLAFTFDVDGLLDPHRAVLALRPGFRFDGRLVRQLLMQLEIDLLAGDLS